MQLYEQLREQAERLGFATMRVIGPQPVPVTVNHPHAQGLVSDPREILPGVQAVVLLAWPYRPYRTLSGQSHLDAYYPASNAAHQAAMQLAEWLKAQGYQADMRAPLPRKPLAERSGLGRYGRNSLIAVDGLGSWVSIQCLLTDAPLPVQPDLPPQGFSGECLTCRACMQACPTGALDGSGHVDISRCLRAQPESEPVREEYRLAMGESLLGCSCCQSCCPRNRTVQPAPPPDELECALDVARLIRGEYKPLIPYLGKNNARKMRIQARAALMAARQGRSDLIGDLTALLDSESEAVRVHVAWALRYLQELRQN